VRKFFVERGSRVKAGQLLATLENNDLAAAMDNKGSYMAAEAAYDTTTKAQCLKIRSSRVRSGAGQSES